MAKYYELGKDYYMPVTVHKDGSEDDCKFPIGIKYNDGDKEMTDYIQDKPGLLLTTSEIAAKVRYRRNVEQENRLEELERENRELKDENGKLTAKVNDLEIELKGAKGVNEYAVETAQNKENLIAEQRELMKKYSAVIDILIDKITALRKGENNG